MVIAFGLVAAACASDGSEEGAGVTSSTGPTGREPEVSEPADPDADLPLPDIDDPWLRAQLEDVRRRVEADLAAAAEAPATADPSAAAVFGVDETTLDLESDVPLTVDLPSSWQRASPSSCGVQPDPENGEVNGARCFDRFGNYTNGEDQDWEGVEVDYDDDEDDHSLDLTVKSDRKAADYVANWFYAPGIAQAWCLPNECWARSMTGNQWEQNDLDFALKVGLDIEGYRYDVVLGAVKVDFSHNWFIGGEGFQSVWDPQADADEEAIKAVYTPDRRYVIRIEDHDTFRVKRTPVDLASPLAFDTATWMTDLAAQLDGRTLSEISIPGTHDSMTWGITTNGQKAHYNEAECHGPQVAKVTFYTDWGIEACDLRALALAIDQPPSRQLEDGIRYLDVRIAAPIGDCEVPETMTPECVVVSHGFESATLADAVRDVVGWLDDPAHAGEQVIMRFQYDPNDLDRDDEDNVAYYEALAENAAAVLSQGDTDVCSRAWTPASFPDLGAEQAADLGRHVTLGEAKAAGRQVLVYFEPDEIDEANQVASELGGVDGCFQDSGVVSNIWPEHAKTNQNDILWVNTSYLRSRRTCLEDPEQETVVNEFDAIGQHQSWTMDCNAIRGVFVTQDQMTFSTDQYAACSGLSWADPYDWKLCDLRITGAYNAQIMRQIVNWKQEGYPINIQIVNLHQSGLTRCGTYAQTVIQVNLDPDRCE